MKGLAPGLLRTDRSLVVLLAIVLVTGVVHFFVVNQRAFLNFYYLPVLFGAYLLGRRQGVMAALLSCALVTGIALANPRQFAGSEDGWIRWLDISTWGCFLVLTSYMVGSLYELKEAKVRELREAYFGVIGIMSKFIDAADRFAADHSRRVSDYCVEVAQGLGLPHELVDDIRVGAYLHDVGKLEVSAEVLNKAAKLTPEEYAEMQTHVEKGERLVRSVGGILRNVVPMISYHHEHWDGKGYKGLRGEQIPLGARIIAVADAYDAMVSDRPYRKGLPVSHALGVLQAEAGRQFDPRVVEVFVQLRRVEQVEQRLPQAA